jgi:hypothetical protein
MDVLGKLYLNDLNYFKAALIPFMLIANRYADSEGVQEYLARFVNFILSQVFEIEQQRKPVEEERPPYNG